MTDNGISMEHEIELLEIDIVELQRKLAQFHCIRCNFSKENNNSIAKAAHLGQSEEFLPGKIFDSPLEEDKMVSAVSVRQSHHFEVPLLECECLNERSSLENALLQDRSRVEALSIRLISGLLCDIAILQYENDNLLCQRIKLSVFCVDELNLELQILRDELGLLESECMHAADLVHVDPLTVVHVIPDQVGSTLESLPEDSIVAPHCVSNTYTYEPPLVENFALLNLKTRCDFLESIEIIFLEKKLKELQNRNLALLKFKKMKGNLLNLLKVNHREIPHVDDEPVVAIPAISNACGEIRVQIDRAIAERISFAKKLDRKILLRQIKIESVCGKLVAVELQVLVQKNAYEALNLEKNRMQIQAEKFDGLLEKSDQQFAQSRAKLQEVTKCLASMQQQVNQREEELFVAKKVEKNEQFSAKKLGEKLANLLKKKDLNYSDARSIKSAIECNIVEIDGLVDQVSKQRALYEIVGGKIREISEKNRLISLEISLQNSQTNHINDTYNSLHANLDILVQSQDLLEEQIRRKKIALKNSNINLVFKPVVEVHEELLRVETEISRLEAEIGNIACLQAACGSVVCEKSHSKIPPVQQERSVNQLQLLTQLELELDTLDSQILAAEEERRLQIPLAKYSLYLKFQIYKHSKQLRALLAQVFMKKWTY